MPGGVPGFGSLAPPPRPHAARPATIRRTNEPAWIALANPKLRFLGNEAPISVQIPAKIATTSKGLSGAPWRGHEPGARPDDGDGAVVVTVTVNGPGALGATLTVGVTEHAASAGAPEHPSAIVPAKPANEFT